MAKKSVKESASVKAVQCLTTLLGVGAQVEVFRSKRDKLYILLPDGSSIRVAEDVSPSSDTLYVITMIRDDEEWMFVSDTKPTANVEFVTPPLKKG